MFAKSTFVPEGISDLPSVQFVSVNDTFTLPNVTESDICDYINSQGQVSLGEHLF